MIRGPGLAIKGFGAPSLFDFLVVLFIIGLPAAHTTKVINANMASALWLVFGSLTLWIVSLTMAQRRAFGSLPLALLTIWVMVNVFLKSWRTPGTAEWYIAWSMLNEGFIYVLAGAIFITTVVRYGKEYGWYLLAILVVMFCWFMTYVLPTKSMSPVMSLLLVVPFVAVKMRERLLAGLFLAPLVLVGGIRFEWLKMKWAARPMMWGIVWDGMNKSPEKFFMGVGFPHDINSMFGWIVSPMGLGYIHNDYLEFTRSHGVIGLLLILWFLVDVFRGARISVAYYLGLSAAILCAFQRTVYFPIQAGVILVLISLIVLENGAAKILPQKESRRVPDAWSI